MNREPYELANRIAQLIRDHGPMSVPDVMAHIGDPDTGSAIDYLVDSGRIKSLGTLKGGRMLMTRREGGVI
jgi:hypothetical protein